VSGFGNIIGSIRGGIAGILICAATGAPLAAHASDFTAEKVLHGMSADERAAYIAGVVEGLAYARYKNDGDQTVGMRCIYDWLYLNEEAPQAILATFKRFPDHTPGAVIAAMAQKECGA
jgi:hypothetical protein